MNGGRFQLAIILAAMVAGTTAFGATTYKWVDKDGVVHYSDQPHPGAKVVQLPGLSGFSEPPAGSAAASGKSQSAAAKVYREFEITSPKTKETLHANDGKVPVTVALAPALKRTHKLVYALDGKTAGATRATSLTLTHVVRGTHTLSVKVEDAQGDTVAEAPPVTFYVRHNSRLFKKNPASQFPNGPARRRNPSAFPTGGHSP